MITWHALMSLNPAMPVGLLSGLLAAYGRELSKRRRPRWRWWLSRILLLPAAVIASAAVDKSLGLTPEAKTLIIMLSVLRGYDGLSVSAVLWSRSFISPHDSRPRFHQKHDSSQSGSDRRIPREV